LILLIFEKHDKYATSVSLSVSPPCSIVDVEDPFEIRNTGSVAVEKEAWYQELFCIELHRRG
jgi:hypothetical protein